MLSVEEVTRLSRAVAREADPELVIVGVAASDGDAQRVELLVTVAGCHPEPCVLMLNLPRNDGSTLTGALREQFKTTLLTHRAT